MSQPRALPAPAPSGSHLLINSRMTLLSEGLIHIEIVKLPVVGTPPPATMVGPSLSAGESGMLTRPSTPFKSRHLFPAVALGESVAKIAPAPRRVPVPR